MGFESQQPRFKLELVNKCAEHMAQGLEEVKVALTKAKDKYTMYYNRHQEPAPVFTQGDRVWLDGSDIATNRPSSKLSHQRSGPFVIDKCVGRGAYRLVLPPQLHRLHPVFPVVKLSPAYPDPILGRQPHPQLSSTVRQSTRSRLYWIVGCATTISSTWSNRRAMMRVIINGRSICSYM
jgi:hypothetical protein